MKTKLYIKLLNFDIREKKLSRNGSLKVLNHALSGPQGKDNCNKFVDILGLRTIFPLFMKTPKKNRKKMLSTEEHEGKYEILFIYIYKFKNIHRGTYGYRTCCFNNCQYVAELSWHSKTASHDQIRRE